MLIYIKHSNLLHRGTKIYEDILDMGKKNLRIRGGDLFFQVKAALLGCLMLRNYVMT
jgi:hypothetical protein